MVRVSSLLPLLTAAVLAVTPLKASPISEIEPREPGSLLGYTDQLELWAALKASKAHERRSPVTLDADIKKVKSLASEKFCQGWLQGQRPPRPTVTLHATSTKVRTAKATATVTSTRTVIDGTSTSFSTSTSVIDEAAPTTSTVVVTETVVVPETKFVSETTTLSFTETTTPVVTESSATPTITESPTVATETIFTTTTAFAPLGGMSRRGTKRPAKPSNLRGYCDEAITKGCFLKLYGVLSYPPVTKTCTDRLTTQTRTSTVVTSKTVDSHVTASTFVVVPTVKTRTVPTTTTTSTTASISTTATETINVSFTASETTTTEAPTTTTTVLYTTTTTATQTATTTSVATATAAAFLLKSPSNNQDDSSIIGEFFKVGSAGEYATTPDQQALVYAAQADAQPFILSAEGLLKTLDGSLTLGLLNPTDPNDPKMAMYPADQFHDPVTCKTTPTADPSILSFTCTAPDRGYGVLNTFWQCGSGDILGIEYMPLGCPVLTIVAVPAPA